MHTYENLPPPKNRDRVKQPVNTTDSSMESDCHGRPEPYCENLKKRNETEGEDGGEKTWLLQSNIGGQNTILDSHPRHGTWSDHHSADKRTSLSIPSLWSHSGECVCVCVWRGAGVAGLETASLFWTHKNLKLVSSKIKTTRTFQCATHIWGLLFGDCMFVLCRCVLSGVMTSPDLTTLN